VVDQNRQRFALCVDFGLQDSARRRRFVGLMLQDGPSAQHHIFLGNIVASGGIRIVPTYRGAISLESNILQIFDQPGLGRQAPQLVRQLRGEHFLRGGPRMLREELVIVVDLAFRGEIDFQLVQEKNLRSFAPLDRSQHLSDAPEFSQKLRRPVAVWIIWDFDVVIEFGHAVHIKQVLHVIGHHHELFFGRAGYSGLLRLGCSQEHEKQKRSAKGPYHDGTVA